MEQNKIDKAIESLQRLCANCEINISKVPSKGQSPYKRCPFRSISNDHCEDFDAISQCLNRLEEVIEIIKHLKDEADYLEECTDGETSDYYLNKYICYSLMLQLIYNDDYFESMKKGIKHNK